MGIYAANGSFNITVVTGAAPVGVYAADGSINVFSRPIPIQTDPQVGVYHPCGAWNVVLNNTTAAPIGAYAQNGAYYVSTNAGAGVYDPNGALRVTVVSGAL